MTTFAHTARQWIAYRQRLVELKLVAPSTLMNQNAIVIVICRSLGDVELDGLRKSAVEIYVGERLQTCQPVTVRGELNVLRQILNWAVDEQLLTVKPRLPTVRVPNVEVSLPNDDAFEWVLANIQPPHSLALEFMMLTGLAPHELERLQRQDLRDHGPAAIGIGQRPDFAVKQPSRRRWVPLNARALTIWGQVSNGLRETGVVFPSVEAMSKAISRLRNSDPHWSPTAIPAGVDRITPKTMRKWFASRVANDQPEHVLQKLMGHAPGSKITREHYVRSTDDQTSQAVGALKL